MVRLVNDAVAADRCPLCGRDNRCGAARGAATCWCFTAAIAADALAAVPPAAKDRACLCPDCAAGRVPSPCVRVCTLAADGTCRGCGRTAEEIAAWPAGGDDVRRAILVRAAARRLRARAPAAEGRPDPDG
jgi:predicted Fe-S protein YdhL (DUF1289 family)